MESDISATEWRQRILKKLWLSRAFWNVILQIVSACCSLLGAYGGSPLGLDTVVDTRNLFLAGSVGWAISTLYSLVLIVQGAGRRFDQVQSSEYLLKDAILQAACAKTPEYDPEAGQGESLRPSQLESLIEFKEEEEDDDDRRGQFTLKRQTSNSTRSVLSNLSKITSSRDLLDASMQSSKGSRPRLYEEFSEEMISSEQYTDEQGMADKIMEKLATSQKKTNFLSG